MIRYKFTRITRNALTVLIAVLMITSVMAPAVAYSPSETDGTTTDSGIETSGATDGAVTNGSDGNAATSNSSAVSAGVRELAAAAQSGDADSGLVTQSSGETRITVTVKTAPGRASAAADAIAAYGDVRTRFAGEIEASLPPDAVDAVADTPAVSAIRRPDPVVGADRGTKVSEGLSNVNATDASLDAGVNGSGVTVAVIDTGFDVGNDEIDDHVVEATDLEGDGIDNETGLHGTAVSELVVDTAPNVSLLLYEVSTGTQVGAAVQDITENTSADVASMSLGLLTGPFDGTSAIDEAIANSVDNGTSWYVSAGNYADGEHYNQTWQDGDGDGLMNVSSSKSSIEVNATGAFDVYVNWNRSGADYDVYLNNESGTEVDNGTNNQSVFDPTEVVSAESAGEYTLRIENESASGKADFDVFVDGAATITPNTSARSVARPATEETAAAVGAVYYGTDGLEGFSSRGPTIDGRTKPDLVAPDGVSTSQPGSSGLNPFFGTSAAAPHAAGVAALILDRANVPLGPDRLAETITAGATRLDSTVPNDRTGYGLVNASAPIAVTECQVIDEPGRYALTQNIATDVDDTCIRITASNVTLDGDGHKIWHDDFGELSIYEAIEVRSVSNVTVRDLTVRYFDDAVEFSNVTDSAVIDLVSGVGTEFFQNRPSQSLGANGIVLRAGSDNNTIRSNDLYSVGDINDFETTGNGIFVRDSDNNTVADNVVSIPGNVGVRLENASDNNVSANEVSAGGVVREPGLAYGVIVAADSDGNFVSENLLRGNSLGEVNGQNGIVVRTFGVGDPVDYAPSDHNRIVDNDIRNFAYDSIAVFDNNATTLVDNEIDGSNEYGIQVDGVERANLTNNVVKFSGQTGGEANVLVGATNLTLVENDATNGYGDGVEIRDARSATIRNNTVGGNDGTDFRLSNTTTLAVENLDLLNYGVSFVGRNVSVSLNDTGAILPGFYEDVHLIDAGKTSPDGFANLTMTYNEDRVTSELGLNESTLALWNYTVNWSQVPEAVFDTSADTLAVNLTTKTNLTADTTYAIAGIDDIEPTVTAYNVTSAGTDLTTSFTASERLAGVLVEIRNGSGLQRTLRLDDFDLRRDIVTNTFDYSTTTTLPEGTYTVELVNASDGSGNNASLTETKSITLDAFLAIESASLIDLEDGDGTVVDGDRVRFSASIDGTNIQQVEANEIRFGGAATVFLSDQGNGVYNGTFTVNADADTTSGTFDVNVSVLDSAGRTAYKRTNSLTFDASLFVESASITDATNGDGLVTDGDIINVSATPGGTNVSSFVANASDFGGPDSVTLSDGDNDGTYTGSFTVGTLVAGNGLQSIRVTLTNDDGRTVSDLTNAITVDVSGPTVSRVTDSEVDGSLNASRVRDGDVVFIKVYATDAGTGLDRVVANASAFGGSDAVALSSDGTYYTGTFTVDAVNAKPDGTYDLPVTAFDKVGASDTQTLSLYMNNTGNDEPPFLNSASATNLDGLNSNVQDGDRIEVSVTASDSDPGIDTIYANASAFGIDRVSLTQASGFTYNATFVVDGANASANGDYDIEIVATDGFGNTANTSTGNLTLNLDSTDPLIISATPTISATAANNGTILEAEVEVIPQGSQVTSVVMNLSALGAGTLNLTEAVTQSVYNATYTVDTSQAGPDGKYFPNVTVTDAGGNTATQPSSIGITLDTKPPVFNNVTATSLNGSSDIARDGDVVRVIANVTDNAGLPGRITADASAFGAGEEILLEFDAEFGVNAYAATFTVNGSEANSDGVYPVPLTATDGPGNTANTTTDVLELNTTGDGETADTTAPTIVYAYTMTTDTSLTALNDGTTVEVEADVDDDGSGVASVSLNASPLGVDVVTLTDRDDDGEYDATFVVDTANASADGTYSLVVSATDVAGNSANRTTSDTITLDTTPPSVENVTAENTDGADGDVRDDDVVRITANVSDATAVTVTGQAGQFGVSGDILMEDDDGDGIYEGTFAVNASAPSIEANGSTVSVSVSATDGAGNTASTLSNRLTLNYSTPDTAPPTLLNATAIDRTDGDGNVSDGDLIEVRVNATDPSGIARLEATVIDFTGETVLSLMNAGGDLYNATFRVDAANASSPGLYTIPVCAEDTLGNAGCERTNGLTLEKDTSKPALSDLQAIDRTDGDGNVSDGDLVEVRVNATDPNSIARLEATIIDFTGETVLSLTNVRDDLYNATFRVDTANASSPGLYTIPVCAEDTLGNAGCERTNELGLDYSTAPGDTTPPTITNATAIDRTDRDGVVTSGDLVELRAFVTDNGSGVRRVAAFPEVFGAGEVVLTKESGDLYNATFVVGSDFPTVNGSYQIPLSAEDEAGNFAEGSTNPLNINASEEEPINDTTPPGITDVQAIDRTDGDGVVSGGDVIEVRAFVSDFDSGVQDVLAFPEPFGVEQVVLTNENGDLYNATFVVNGTRAFADDIYRIPLIAVDRAENVANTTTSGLTLNVTRRAEDVTPPTILDVVAIDRTDNDSVVSDGDLIEVRATVVDNGSGVVDVVAFPEAFGADEVFLTNAGGDVYNGTFRVDAAFAAPDDVYPVQIVAVDGAGNDVEATSNLLDLDRATGADDLVSITGSIADGSPGGANTVSAFVRDTGDAFPPRISLVDETVTGEGGNFTLEVPANGTYDIVHYQGDIPSEQSLFPGDGIPDVLALERVTVGESGTTIGERTLPGGNDLNVSVVDESGNPVEGARVAYFHTENDSQDRPALAGLDTLPTNANGFADVSGMENVTRSRPGIEVTGNVTVLVLPPEGDGRFVRQDYVRTLTVTEDDRITVTLQEADEPATGTLEGTVTNSTGAPLPGVDVAIINATTDELVELVRTDANGAYAAEVLAGTYDVGVDPGGFERKLIEGVPVSANTTTIVDFAVNETADAGGPSGPTTDVRLEPVSATIGTGGTTTFDVVVTNASGGVGAITTTVSLTDSAVANITDFEFASDVSFDALGGAETNISTDNSSVSVSAFGVKTNDTGAVTIATVTIKGNSSGTTGVDLAVSALGNESGTEYVVNEVHNASLTVTAVPKIGPFENAPTDPDGDGFYEDINGNGEANIVDVQAMFVNREDAALTSNPQYFDFNGGGDVNVVDVQKLFNELRS